MRLLTYKVVTEKGVVRKALTLAEAKEIVAKEGGSYKVELKREESR